MAAPSLKFTRWLGDIPLSGQCSICLSKARFQVKQTAKPDKTGCKAQLQQAFDRHLEGAHGGEESKSHARRDSGAAKAAGLI
jgi:hypothetical protein